jgi:hypothetical protein
MSDSYEQARADRLDEALGIANRNWERANARADRYREALEHCRQGFERIRRCCNGGAPMNITAECVHQVVGIDAVDAAKSKCICPPSSVTSWGDCPVHAPPAVDWKAQATELSAMLNEQQRLGLLTMGRAEKAEAELSRMTARHECACAENLRLRADRDRLSAEVARLKEALETIRIDCHRIHCGDDDITNPVDHIETVANAALAPEASKPVQFSANPCTCGNIQRKCRKPEAKPAEAPRCGCGAILNGRGHCPFGRCQFCPHADCKGAAK